MRSLGHRFGMLVFGTVLFASTSSVLAYDAWGIGSWSPYRWAVTRAGSTSRPGAPYFAVHPPVYYGRQVQMVYGDSPFVRLPRTEVPANAVRPRREAPESAVAGQWITNPFCPPNRTSAAPRAPESGPSSATVPGMIENPFFRPRDSASVE